MTHVVAEPCLNCKYTDCVTVCPVECFYEGEAMLFIHPEECIDCEACVPECPTEAIFYQDDLPKEWADYLALNAEKAPKSPVITERKKTPLGPPIEGRRLGFGEDFVSYHSLEKMGTKFQLGRSKTAQFVTNKHPRTVLGGTAWMISGAGTPRTFLLHGWFTVDEWSETNDPDFKYVYGGGIGKQFKPPVVLNDLEWFPEFKKSQSNFSLGLQKIQPEFAEQFELLAEQ